MTRTYALKRLLEHGPMTFKELLECTRWTYEQLNGAVQWCLKAGSIRKKKIVNRSGHERNNVYMAIYD